MSQIIKLSLEELSKKYPKLRASDIESLIKRMVLQRASFASHLPEICDNSLALFLHKNSYHVESTRVNIDHYYTVRTHMPEFFTDRDPVHNENLRRIFDIICILPLQQLSEEGNNTMLLKFINNDASKFHVHDYVKYILLTADLWIYLSKSVDGYTVIFDTQDVGLEHAARINPFIMKKYFFYIANGVPFKLKELHFVNVTHGMERILSISKPLMSKEILKVLHLHSSIKTLKKFVSLKALPNELGGNAGPLMDLHRAHIEELEMHRDWFLEQELRNQVDETKRPGKSKRAEDFFGLEDFMGDFMGLNGFSIIKKGAS